MIKLIVSSTNSSTQAVDAARAEECKPNDQVRITL